LFWLLCFFSFSPVWVRQWRHKAIANTSKYAGWKNFSYNTFVVDVTLAICELSQKSSGNVNISASTVPEGFLATVKIPIISMEPPLRENFFRCRISCAHKQQLKQFVHCWLLEKLPWNAKTLLVCHTNTDPMRISIVFKKIILDTFWPRLPNVKVSLF